MKLTTFACWPMIFEAGLVANAQSKTYLREAVRLELTNTTQTGAPVHWKITNSLDTALYVYNFYLWGPAYHVEKTADEVIIDTTPIAEQACCPPI